MLDTVLSQVIAMYFSCGFVVAFFCAILSNKMPPIWHYSFAREFLKLWLEWPLVFIVPWVIEFRNRK